MNNYGREFDLWVSSKAPMNEFGNMPKSTVTAIVGNNALGNKINENIDNDFSVYHGDGNDAKFTPDETESSRLFMYMHIDTNKGIVSNAVSSSFGTENLITHKNTMANPVSFAKLEKGTSEYGSSVLGFGYSGANPDLDTPVGINAAPDIDVQGQLRFSEDKSGDLLIQGEVNGDGFPATSMFAHFGDTKLMIASSPIPKDGTVYDLIGPADKRIMNINLSVEFKEDTPVVVKDWNSMKEYSVDEWNTLHESTPMIESEGSREVIIDKGKHISQLEVAKEFIASSSYIEINVNEEIQSNTQEFDSTIAAKETLAQLNLTDFSQSNENAYAMEMD